MAPPDALDDSDGDREAELREHPVAMFMLTAGPVGEQARSDLAGALDSAEIEAPDETGVFEVRVPAHSFQEALSRVWNAVAAAGVDDQIAFAEHPGLPEHWRHRARGPEPL